MVRFRESARTRIRNKFAMYNAIYLDVGAQQYRTFVLDAFIGVGPGINEKRASLLKLAPGDWRVRG
eukprot:240811-Pyramimonas_sp.AAC.1